MLCFDRQVDLCCADRTTICPRRGKRAGPGNKPGQIRAATVQETELWRMKGESARFSGEHKTQNRPVSQLLGNPEQHVLRGTVELNEDVPDSLRP